VTQRYVTLGDGRTIGLGKYVEAWRQCRQLAPGTPIGKGVDGWGQTAAEALVDLRRGLEDRINKGDPAFGKGRKWGREYQVETMRAAYALNQPRLVIYWLPPWLKGRFADRLAQRGEL
jgi:hypothetical protein